MTVARSVADVLRDHVTLELEGIDRMYLNVYVPLLQTVGGTVWYLREHRKQPYASTAAVAPMTEAFVRSIEAFVDRHGIDLVSFEKRQRKDDVTQKYLQRFTGVKACFTSARRRRGRRSLARSAVAVPRRARLTPGSSKGARWSTTIISTASMKTSVHSS
jgi:hypothetical protein